MSKTPSTPTPPAAPTAGASLREWVEMQPEMFAAEEKYAPQYADLYKQISEQLYPETAGLQEQLAGQAARGAESEVPEWMRSEYLSNMRAQLGENVKSGIGADYMSTGLMQQKQDWQNYYRNLGLTVSGRQPLAQPQFQTQGLTPQSVMGMNTGTYGTQMAGWQTQAGIAQQQNQMNQMMPFMALQGAGNLMGSMAGTGGMF